MHLSPLSPALTVLASLLLLSQVCLALPLPLPAPPTPEEPPLPGRSDISKDQDGVITGHWGDDFLPAHMRHVQQNQAEYPENANAFPINDDDDRTAKIGGSNVRAGKHPVTGESRVKDEKPLNSQKIPGGQNYGTTMQTLPHTESGGAPKTPGQIAYKKDVSSAPDPQTTDLPGNARTEASLTGKMKAAAETELDQPQPGPGAGTTKVTANPGWLPLKDDQLRGHEAPAVMTNQADGTDRKLPPPPQPKPKPDSGKGKKTSPETKKPAPAPAPADKDNTQKAPEEDTRRKSTRPTTVDNSAKAGAPRPPKAPAEPGSSKIKPASAHKNYRPSQPQVSGQYKPGQKTEEPIHPPEEDPSRLPPRPQNSATGSPQQGPPRYPPPPPEKPKAKDDSDVPPPSGTHEKLPDGQTKGHNFPPLNLPGGPSGPSGSSGGSSSSSGGPPPSGGSTDLPSHPAPKDESKKDEPKKDEPEKDEPEKDKSKQNPVQKLDNKSPTPPKPPVEASKPPVEASKPQPKPSKPQPKVAEPVSAPSTSGSKSSKKKSGKF